jgi:hypothetical protein
MPDPEEDPHGPSAQKSAFKPVDSDQFQIGTRTEVGQRVGILSKTLHKAIQDGRLVHNIKKH